MFITNTLRKVYTIVSAVILPYIARRANSHRTAVGRVLTTRSKVPWRELETQMGAELKFYALLVAVIWAMCLKESVTLRRTRGIALIRCLCTFAQMIDS